VTEEATKVCSKCGQTKVVSAFRRGNTCKECANAYGREYSKTYYPANREAYIARATATRQDFRSWYNELKSKPCTDCKQTFDPVCMDFDHVEDHKLLDVSVMAQRGMNRQKILDEIAKCELVCANCHRLRTKARRG
jgi:hypothetical protein